MAALQNRKLLTERDRVKQKVAGLVAEKADLKVLTTNVNMRVTYISC